MAGNDAFAGPQAVVGAASRLFRRARYDAALALLAPLDQWPDAARAAAVLIRAEILSRRDPAASLRELAQRQDLFRAPAERFEYLIASGRACANVRDFDGAAALFRRARELAGGEHGAAALGRSVRPRLAYQEARLRWMQGDHDPACEQLNEALRDATPMGRVAALALRGWMHAGLECYDEQIDDFLAALELASAHPEACDVAVVGLLLHSLLAVAVDVGDVGAVGIGKAAWERLPWTSDTRVDQFLCARALAWHTFLHGELAEAQWRFLESKALAPSVAWQVMAHVDRAHVAQAIGNERWAIEELRQAHLLAEQVAWESTRGEERLALAKLAVLFAPVDMRRAQTYIETYGRIGLENVSPTVAMSHERRKFANDQYAAGRVQQVLGNRELACEHLTSAYAVFDATRQRYRAALAADALHEITGDPVWRERMHLHVAAFPRSPIPVRGAPEPALPSDARYGALTPLQRQLLRAVCAGGSPETISGRFSRSTFTLRAQIDELCARFSVRTVGALRAEVRRSGIVVS